MTLLHLLEQQVVAQWHKLLQKQAVHQQHLLRSNGTNYSQIPNGFTVTDVNGTAKVLNVDYTANPFTFTGSGTSGVFGEIQDPIITNAGSTITATLLL